MDRETVTKILVRGPNWLGDAVMCEPALRGLRRLFPDAQITLLVNPVVADLFVGYPGVTRMHIYETQGRHAGLFGMWKLIQELREYGFDLAVLFQNAFEAALLSFLIGVPRRYGYTTDGRWLFLSNPIPAPNRSMRIHQVLYYWNLLKSLGLTGDPSAPKLVVLPEEEQAMARRLTQGGVTASDIVVGVNPGSTYGGAKRWMPERFAEATDRLCRTIQESRQQQVSVVIFGAKGEERLGQDIATRLSVRSLVLSGTTTIRELMVAVKRCEVLLTNDTGPMHIASAFQIPVVAVFGPTDWQTTSPYKTPSALVRQPVECSPCLLRECPIDHRCMTRVSVDQVYEAATKQVVGLSSSFSSSGIISRHLWASNSSTTLLAGATVFLDRDGTLNEDPGYLSVAAQLKLLAGVGPALARLKEAGARLVLVTNQSGVGRGIFTLKDLNAIHARLADLLKQEGVALDAVYACVHHPDDGCHCRKPNIGMVEQAVSELHLDLRRSYLIGDHVCDIQLANRVGAKSILLAPIPLDTQAWGAFNSELTKPHVVVTSMTNAVDWIFTDAIKRQEKSSITEKE